MHLRRSMRIMVRRRLSGKVHLTELAALQRKLREVEMDRDILKKAVGIFSKETDNGSNS